MSVVTNSGHRSHSVVLTLDQSLPISDAALQPQSTGLECWERQVLFQLFAVQRRCVKSVFASKGIGVVQLVGGRVVEFNPFLDFGNRAVDWRGGESVDLSTHFRDPRGVAFGIRR